METTPVIVNVHKVADVAEIYRFVKLLNLNLLCTTCFLNHGMVPWDQSFGSSHPLPNTQPPNQKGLLLIVQLLSDQLMNISFWGGEINLMKWPQCRLISRQQL